MRKCALAVGVALALGAVAGGSILDDMSLDWTHATTPVLHDPWSRYENLSGGQPTTWVMSPMEVTVTPAWPVPFEEVVVTISGRCSDPYMTLGDATVHCEGNNVMVELQWRNSSLHGAVFSGASAGSGYSFEQVPPTVYRTWDMEPYEATVSLGGFDVGRYRVYVVSKGALEGEAQASFEVTANETVPLLFDFIPSNPIMPFYGDPMPRSSFIPGGEEETRTLVVGFWGETIAPMDGY